MFNQNVNFAQPQNSYIGTTAYKLDEAKPIVIEQASLVKYAGVEFITLETLEGVTESNLNLLALSDKIVLLESQNYMQGLTTFTAGITIARYETLDFSLKRLVDAIMRPGFNPDACGCTFGPTTQSNGVFCIRMLNNNNLSIYHPFIKDYFAERQDEIAEAAMHAPRQQQYYNPYIDQQQPMYQPTQQRGTFGPNHSPEALAQQQAYYNDMVNTQRNKHGSSNFPQQSPNNSDLQPGQERRQTEPFTIKSEGADLQPGQ